MTRFLLGKSRTGMVMWSKFTRYDVAEMRRWVRQEGFACSLGQQIATIRTWYPTMSECAIRNVLLNDSFFDPTYDRRTPLIDPVYPVVWSVPRLVLLVILWRMLCGAFSPVRS